MSSTTGRLRDSTLPGPAFVTAGEPHPVASGALGHAAEVIFDVLTGLGVILAIPFAILAIGLPLVLLIRLLLWIGRMD